MMDQANRPVDLKAYLPQADPIIDALPWRRGRTNEQHRLARGRTAALAHHVAALLATGWTAQEVRAALAEASTAASAPDPAAQERLWRAALKRAKNARRPAEQDTHRSWGSR
jgi:hypothetical protein